MYINTIYESYSTEDDAAKLVDLTNGSDNDIDDVKVEGYHGHPNLNSVDPDHTEDSSNPIPGDLVISSLRDVKHPA